MALKDHRVNFRGCQGAASDTFHASPWHFRPQLAHQGHVCVCGDKGTGPAMALGQWYR